MPHIRNYLPSTIVDYEIMLFNSSLLIPNRLKHNNDIAQWIMNSEYLNRNQVHNFMLNENHYDILILLIEHICRRRHLNLVDSLKEYIACTGVFLYVANGVGSSSVRYFIEIFSQIYSKNVLESEKSSSLDPLVICGICESLIDINNTRTSNSDNKLSSVSLNDFFQIIRTFRRSNTQHVDPTVLSSIYNDFKLHGYSICPSNYSSRSSGIGSGSSSSLATNITNFNDSSCNASSSLITSSFPSVSYSSLTSTGNTISSSISTPSYYFTNVYKKQIIYVSLNISENKFLPRMALLSHNGIYLFPVMDHSEKNIINGNNDNLTLPDTSPLPKECIPLSNVKCTKEDLFYFHGIPGNNSFNNNNKDSSHSNGNPLLPVNGQGAVKGSSSSSSGYVLRLSSITNDDKDLLPLIHYSNSTASSSNGAAKPTYANTHIHANAISNNNTSTNKNNSGTDSDSNKGYMNKNSNTSSTHANEAATSNMSSTILFMQSSLSFHSTIYLKFHHALDCEDWLEDFETILWNNNTSSSS